MSIYAKLAKAREMLRKESIKKSGFNTHLKGNYFELEDFLPQAEKCLYDNGLIALVTSIGKESGATLEVREIEGDGIINISTDYAASQMAQPIQAHGSSITYLRRYLWMILMEILVQDMAESLTPEDAKKVSNDPITDKQAAQLRDELEAVSGDEQAFCKWAKVGKLEEIYARNFDTVLATIRRKAA